MTGIERKRCPICNIKMIRAYIRVKVNDKWQFKAKGWYCYKCGNMWSD